MKFLPPLLIVSRQVSALPADLNADARNLQFDAGLPPLFAPVFAVLFAALSTTICPNLVAVAVAITRFDAPLLTNRAYTLLPTHALGAGLLGDECNRATTVAPTARVPNHVLMKSSFVV